MGFHAEASTLQSLEWPQVLARLAACCRTPLGRRTVEAAIGARAAGGEPGDGGRDDDSRLLSLFEATEAGVRTRLAETSEARALLDAESLPPLAGVADVGPLLRRAAKGGMLDPHDLLDVRRVLEALHAMRRHGKARAEEAPRLAALAETLEEEPDLLRAIEAAIDDAGEVRDNASPALASARRESQQLAGELQTRIGRYLQNADVAPHLSDGYYTVRNDRYVLPVKADARGRVRGIVHDASRSGTTLFIEPEGMVDLNNRHRQAQLAAERERTRVLRDLTVDVARVSTTLGYALETLEALDLAYARGELSRKMEACEPEIGREGIFELPQLRHPLIAPEQCVANDLRLGADFDVLILSGPNAGGKTVALKAVALAALLVRAGLHVPAASGCRVDLVDGLLADIGDHQDIGESLSTFSAHMASLADILRRAGPHVLIALDEIGVGTDPAEGAALAQSILEELAARGARTITTTHYNLLKEMAEVEPRFENASVEFDPETLAPTYRVRIGAPGASSASTVAARMGMPSVVLERANTLLDHEDRRLDRILTELAASRATLDMEKQQVERLRAEGEAARDEYRTKLQRLQERRDKLFAEMKGDLETAFRDAHGEVARVIAELQRTPSSQKAARSREKLLGIAEQTAAVEEEVGVGSSAVAESAREAIDWPRAKPGDNVEVPGGRSGTLMSLPDRRGRVSVQVGPAKLTLEADKLFRAGPASTKAEEPRAARRATHEVRRSELPRGGTLECDVRGLRVDEALDRVDEALDLALADGYDAIRIIHGHGTGALRSAVGEHLRRSKIVIEHRFAAAEEGGSGATVAALTKS